jgi:hypothetical protein
VGIAKQSDAFDYWLYCCCSNKIPPCVEIPMLISWRPLVPGVDGT